MFSIWRAAPPVEILLAASMIQSRFGFLGSSSTVAWSLRWLQDWHFKLSRARFAIRTAIRSRLLVGLVMPLFQHISESLRRTPAPPEAPSQGFPAVRWDRQHRQKCKASRDWPVPSRSCPRAREMGSNLAKRVSISCSAMRRHEPPNRGIEATSFSILTSCSYW